MYITNFQYFCALSGVLFFGFASGAFMVRSFYEGDV